MERGKRWEGRGERGEGETREGEGMGREDVIGVEGGIERKREKGPFVCDLKNVEW